MQGLLLHQLEHQVVEDVAVLDQDLPRLVVRGLDEPAHLVVDGRGDLLGVVALVAHVAAEEDLAVLLAELAAPSLSLMPYWVTIARAIAVAFSMSLLAPVVGSWKTSSSAVRPPSSIASWSIISERVTRNLSSVGSVIV